MGSERREVKGETLAMNAVALVVYGVCLAQCVEWEGDMNGREGWRGTHR